jgi:hypothetical protein
MKALFAPNYFYLNLGVFQLVANALRKQASEAIFVRTAGNRPTSADLIYTDDYLRAQGLCIENIVGPTSSTRRNRLAQVIRVRNDFRQIQRSLSRIEPDVVVVGSDLGNLRLRLLLTACEMARVPIAILYTCDLPAPRKDVLSRFLSSRIWRAGSTGRLFHAIIFRGNTPGEFATNGQIGVMSDEIRNALVLRGISQDRITVTGIPYPSPSRDFEKDSSHAREILVLSPLHYEHGAGVPREALWKAIRDAARLDSRDQFVLKFHPRESGSVVSSARAFFEGTGITVISEGSAEERLHRARLVVTPNSRVLYSAIAARVAVILLEPCPPALEGTGLVVHDDLATLPKKIADMSNQADQINSVTTGRTSAIPDPKGAVDAMVGVLLKAVASRRTP